MDDRVLYSEAARLWPLWAAPAPFLFASAVMLVLGNGAAAAGVLVATGIVWLSGVVPLVLSRRRYNRITLTPTELRVGRERFALSSLDLEPLRTQAGGLVVRAAPDSVFDVLAGERRTGYRMAGGSWGPTLGERHLALRERETGALRAVGTRDPVALARHVLDAAEHSTA